MNIEEANRELKRISEKDYTARIAHALGRHEEQDTGELATGGVIEPARIVLVGADNGSPEIVHAPKWWHSPVLNALSEDDLRTMIREEVHRALYPTAEMANPHRHRRIEMTTEQGKKWRGVLYLVEKEQEG